MNRPATQGFQKPVHGSTKPVRLAMVRDDPNGFIECTCGWSKLHRRKKVREDAAEAHLGKQHGGVGMWV